MQEMTMRQLVGNSHSGDTPVCARDMKHAPLAKPALDLMHELLWSCIVLAEDWEALPRPTREEAKNCEDPEDLLALLIKHGLMTPYQAGRVSAGTTHGLVLGSYRILERIGAGGMAVVFKAEHIHMRHQVAVKVLPLRPDQDVRLQTRFISEMRTLAGLRHPNIVFATDAGHLQSRVQGQPTLWYLVMEYVSGPDLEDLVMARGPLPLPRACKLISQVAGALAETHKFQLVHRDIKPSNVLVNAEDEAKLLDFGLSRRFETRLTQPGAIMGTIDYMAPEQARDASTVDIRADIYGLGGTLFWCLTAQPPFPADTSAAESLRRRLNQSPPSLAIGAPHLPRELDAVIARMMAVNPDDRFATPQAVMRALLPFVKTESAEPCVGLPARLAAPSTATTLTSHTPTNSTHRALIVDDQAEIRNLCRTLLEGDGIVCAEAVCGVSALEALQAAPFDLMLLDVELPRMKGLEVLRRLREMAIAPHLKVIMVSGCATADQMAQMLTGGATDYLTKPFSVTQFRNRAQAALRLKDAQDRSEALYRQLLGVNGELERDLNARTSDLTDSRNGLMLGLVQLAQFRGIETGAHVVRVQRYCRTLAEKAATLSTFVGQIDEPFTQMLECCAPVHDIGKVALADGLLRKTDKLTTDERILMQTHTTIGAEALAAVLRQHGASMAFLQTAIDIARHHHERFDGDGYPDRLAGNAIPLCAQIVSVADVYDALRSSRPHRPAMSHAAAVKLMSQASRGQFNPVLIQAFVQQADEFERIFHESAD